MNIDWVVVRRVRERPRPVVRAVLYRGRANFVVTRRGDIVRREEPIEISFARTKRDALTLRLVNLFRRENVSCNHCQNNGVRGAASYTLYPRFLYLLILFKYKTRRTRKSKIGVASVR